MRYVSTTNMRKGDTLWYTQDRKYKILQIHPNNKVDIQELQDDEDIHTKVDISLFDNWTSQFTKNWRARIQNDGSSQ